LPGGAIHSSEDRQVALAMAAAHSKARLRQHAPLIAHRRTAPKSLLQVVVVPVEKR
jgi:hypothetical protein